MQVTASAESGGLSETLLSVGFLLRRVGKRPPLHIPQEGLHNTRPVFLPHYFRNQFSSPETGDLFESSVDGISSQARRRRYLNEGGQEHGAHFLLQDDLVLPVVVTRGDEGGEQHLDEPRVAEVREGQLAQLLQHRGVAAGLYHDLKQGAPRSVARRPSLRGACQCKPQLQGSKRQDS